MGAMLLGLPLLVWAWPGVALASGDGDGNDTDAVVLAILSVGAAYLLARFLVERLRQWLLVVTGVEYIVLGILLGPMVPQIHAFEDLTGMMPVIALAAGWVGLLRGMELDIDRLRRPPRGALRLAMVHGLAAGGLTGGAAFQFFLRSGLFPEVTWQEAAISATVLGCCAAAGSSHSIDLVSGRYETSGELTPLLRRSACLGDSFALLAFGMVFCVFHQGVEGAALAATPTEWAVISIGLGLALGGLFRFFLAGDESENARFLALVGIITFASGAAYLLNLSPLQVNLVLGVVLVNSAQQRERLQTTLLRTQRPMELVLLVLAGALWMPPDLVPAAIGLGGYVVLRIVAKATGGLLASWGLPLRKDLFRGLLGHGDATVAMAISFRLVYDGPTVDAAYTVILASVVLHDLAATRLLRALLVDAGELKRELQAGTTT